MKITFQNQEYINRDLQVNTQKGKMPEKMGADKNGVAATFGAGIPKMGDNLFDQGDDRKKGKSLAELQQEVGAIDVTVAQNYQTVLSNTLSREDYAKAQEEGFDYRNMDYRDVVTIQDKIKAEVAKGGEVIVGYNDDLSSEQLAKVLGNENLARDVESSFSERDIPLTEENISDIQQAWKHAQMLEAPSEEAVAYMIENDMEPTVWNFYIAQNSGASAKNLASNQGKIDLFDANNEKLLEQVKGTLKEAGYDGKLEDAQWLLDKNLPVTEDTIKNLENINSVEFPVKEDTFALSAAAAIVRGEDPIHANLLDKDNVFSKASEVVEKYFSADLWEQTVSDISARRQLEEVRLSMTSEVNLKLIESGFSIDTAPMEELIDALKEAEKMVAAKYFPEFSENEEAAVSSYRLMNETNSIIADMATLPAANLGMFTIKSAEEVNVSEFNSEGKALRDTYEKAGNTYEALMTAPRADLGDSIKKAFGNVADLAKELGIETAEENLRAIRILGYNQMEVTNENVEKIVAADSMVQNVIKKMTPAAVLEMIRDGVNPLEQSFAALDTYFDNQDREGFEKQSKDYSEFLYGLEMQDEISEDERKSFIGIYRLIHQVESLDDAAVGSVINMEAELDFKNLLTAVRTRKLHGIDVTLDKNYGAASEIIKDSISITEQIEAAFRSERYDRELEELRKAADVSRETVNYIRQFDITESADNLIAMEELLSKEGNLFEEISKYDKANARVKEITKRAEDSMEKGDFEEEYAKSNEELAEITQELALEADNYIDVKALSLVNRQLTIANRISEKNNTSERQDYIIPMEIGDSVSKVHLSFVNGEGHSSLSISLALAEGESMEAYFEIKDSKLEGYLVGNTADELKKMESISDIFNVALNNNENLKGLSDRKIPVVSREADRPVHNIKQESKPRKDAMVSNSDGAERKILLQVTRVFLQSVRGI